MKDSNKVAKPKIDKECPVVQNLLEICLADEMQVSEVGKSILAMSFPRREYVQILRRGGQTRCNLSEEQVQQLDSLPADANFDSEESLDNRPDDEENMDLYRSCRRRRAHMGNTHYASMRNAFSCVTQDLPFPMKARGLRIAPEKLIVAILFLDQVLEVLNGQTRNVRMGAAVIENVRILNRGGLSKDELFKIFSGGAPSHPRVGKPTFG